MPDTMTVRLVQDGTVVLPQIWREAYHLRPGDNLTLLDLGGVFVLSPRRSEIDALADRLTQTLMERGETLESMQQALREERERYAGQG